MAATDDALREAAGRLLAGAPPRARKDENQLSAQHIFGPSAAVLVLPVERQSSFTRSRPAPGLQTDVATLLAQRAVEIHMAVRGSGPCLLTTFRT
jgi:hypothetical protein